MMPPGVRMVAGAMPRPPVAIADAVELYARETRGRGQHATLHFLPITGTMGCWQIRFTLKPDDPRLLLYQQGEVAEPPTEHVWLHEPLGPDEEAVIPTYRYRPLDIVAMGPSGIRAWLDRGNLWSGRGEQDSLEQQVKDSVDAGVAQSAQRRAEAESTTRAVVRDRSRWYRRILSLPVRLWSPSSST